MIFCEFTLFLNYILEATGHGIDQILQVLNSLHLLGPQLDDLLPELLQVGAPGRLLQLVLHSDQHVLDQILFLAVIRPLHQCDGRLIFKSFFTILKIIEKNLENKKMNSVSIHT